MKGTIKLYTLSIIFLILLSSCKQEVNNNTETKKETIEVDPLPSWNDVESKSNIIAYVKDVTNSESNNFISIKDRIATFDNDGNLWSEQPIYFQLFFVLDRIKEMASEHPEWKDQQPFKAVLENDMETIKRSGMKGIGKLLMTTHAGNTTEEFDAIVKDWV